MPIPRRDKPEQLPVTLESNETKIKAIPSINKASCSEQVNLEEIRKATKRLKQNHTQTRTKNLKRFFKKKYPLIFTLIYMYSI